MFLHFYDFIETEKANAFEFYFTQMKDDILTPAEVNKILFTNYQNPEIAIQQIVAEIETKWNQLSVEKEINEVFDLLDSVEKEENNEKAKSVVNVELVEQPITIIEPHRTNGKEKLKSSITPHKIKVVDNLVQSGAFGESQLQSQELFNAHKHSIDNSPMFSKEDTSSYESMFGNLMPTIPLRFAPEMSRLTDSGLNAMYEAMSNTNVKLLEPIGPTNYALVSTSDFGHPSVNNEVFSRSMPNSDVNIRPLEIGTN
jgi:hypothetical protein